MNTITVVRISNLINSVFRALFFSFVDYKCSDCCGIRISDTESFASSTKSLGHCSEINDLASRLML